MIPLPTQLPVWATTDQIDPVNLQNNVVEPPPAYQQFGWTRSEFPPRQWFNWLGRNTYECLAYLLQQQALNATTVDASGGTPIVNVIIGGLVLINVVDTAVNGNYFSGICYVPPSPGSATTINVIKNNAITITGGVQTNGGVIITGTGTGPYIISGQTLP